MKITDNRMFSEMLIAARQRLSGKNPSTIASKTNIEFDDRLNVFRLSSLGQNVTVTYPDYELTPELGGWHQLVILHYMDLADGAPLENTLISFAQMKDGMIRGGGFDRKCEAAVEDLMNSISEGELEARCIAMGGVLTETNADFSVVFPFLPNYPITLKIWFADDEFGASGRMLADQSADHYLTIEDAVTVGEVILEQLANNQ